MSGGAPPTQYPVIESTACLGRHLARRLVEIGCSDVFSVPGDFNLILLDHLLAEPGLNNIGCCNEINAGYAADGYARWKGVGAVVVTFTVGGLSVINSIAGAYSENLPVICIVGGPNSNDYGTNRILHHTIGIPDFTQEYRCFQTVTCFQAMISWSLSTFFFCCLSFASSSELRCQECFLQDLRCFHEGVTGYSLSVDEAKSFSQRQPCLFDAMDYLFLETKMCSNP